MNTPPNPCYMVDNQSNLYIQTGRQRVLLTPADALELLKFVERTGYQAQANATTKGTPQ